MNLMTNALKVFSENPNKIAIIDSDGMQITFGDFRDKVSKFCTILKDRGIKKESKVYLLTPVNIELYALISAIFSLGAIVVFIDPWAKKSYIENSLKQVEPDFLIHVTKALPLFLKIKKIREIKNKINLSEILKCEKTTATSQIIPTEVDNEDSALITFTTGSTGTPKGFDRTHGFLNAQHKAHEKYFNHTSADIDLCMFPVFVLSNLGSAMTSVLADIDLKKVKSADPLKLIHQIESFNVSSLTCSPAFVETLVEYAKSNALSLPQLKKFFTGGAPINPLLFKQLKPIFPNAKMTLIYGSTEAEPIATMDAEEVIALGLKGDGVALGRVVSEINLKIIEISQDAQTTIKEVAAGEIGEIILSGEFVGKKYYKNIEAMKECKIIDQDGKIWHRTGDLGHMDENKILYMSGRINNIVIENEKTIFPLSVECPINNIEGVERSAFFQYSKNQSALVVKLHRQYVTSKEKIYIQIQEIVKKQNIKPAFFSFVNQIPLDARHNAKIEHRELINTFGQDEINQLKAQPLIKRLISYTNERLPVVPVFLLSTLFAINSFLLGQKIFTATPKDFLLAKIIAVATIFLTFFQLRIMDEFKDYQEDLEAYPERILSRGIVSKSDLKKILAVVIGGQIILNIFTTPLQMVLWLAMFGYSLLMYKEFFIGKILKQTMMGYLISHQLILPIMVSYCFTAITSNLVDAGFSTSLLIAFVMVSIPSTIYEIGRKCWSPEREHPTADSYTKFWGIARTSLFIISLLGLYLATTVAATEIFKLKASYVMALIATMLFLLLATINFWRKPITKNSKLVELGGSLILLLGHILVILANLK